MIVLGLDTTGQDCSVGLVNEAHVLAVSRDHIKRGHAEHIGMQVERVLAKAEISVNDIDRIVVCNGPGSFTGLRVALAFAKGLALPRQIDVVGVSALHVWAAMADPEQSRALTAAADVRRGEIFAQEFYKGKAVSAPQRMLADDVKHCVGSADISMQSRRVIDPCILAWVGMEIDPKDAPAKALYHRPPDAKLPGGIDPVAGKQFVAPKKRKRG